MIKYKWNQSDFFKKSEIFWRFFVDIFVRDTHRVILLAGSISPMQERKY